MPYKPVNVIAEILGKASVPGYDPGSDNYFCPFIESKCIKRSLSDPYPVCGLWKGVGHEQKALDNLICVCPKRFYAVDFLKDVITHCWPGDLPANPKIAREVQMQGFGNVDFVIADTLPNGDIGQFLSVELQAIDITGSVRLAYDALIANEELIKRPSYSFNWKNVYKRYITQLIAKGYYHHHWNTKIVAVIQDQVYRYIKNEADFMCTTDVKNPNVNIIFMTYAFDSDPNNLGEYIPVLKTIEGTSHSSLQNAILYKSAPDRDKFCQQISRRLDSHINISEGKK